MSATMRDKIKYFCQQKGMTEEQLADEINKAFEQSSGEELIHPLHKGAAIGRREMLDKACEWLNDNLPLYWGQVNADNTDRFVRIFKKAMEE